MTLSRTEMKVQVKTRKEAMLGRSNIERREIQLQKSPQFMERVNFVKVGCSKITEGLECWEGI